MPKVSSLGLYHRAQMDDHLSEDTGRAHAQEGGSEGPALPAPGPRGPASRTMRSSRLLFKPPMYGVLLCFDF